MPKRILLDGQELHEAYKAYAAMLEAYKAETKAHVEYLNRSREYLLQVCSCSHNHVGVHSELCALNCTGLIVRKEPYTEADLNRKSSLTQYHRGPK